MSTSTYRREHRNLIAALLFLSPNFLGFLVFVAFPVAFSFIMSFTNWTPKPAVSLEWVGLRNYMEILRDQDFWYYFYNTAYLMLGIPISIAGSLFLAIVLSQKLRGVVFFRTLFYLPQFTAGVALFILWKTLYNKDFGLINSAIDRVTTWIGYAEFPLPDWLGSVTWAKPAIMIMGIWGAIGGTNMLLYLAGLTNIPQELYEAADIDGAGVWSKFRHVTWPQLAPTTFFIVVMSTIGGLQGGFEQARVMTNGGPGGSTTTLSYYIYTKGFQQLEFGYAASIAWVLFVMIFTLTLLNWRFGNRYVNY